MSNRDLLRTTLAKQSLAPAVRTNGTATGTAIDTQGFDAAVAVVSFGAYTDGTHTPSLLESTDGTTYTAAGTGDVDGSFSAVSGTAGANTAQSVGYIGSQRFVKVAMTTSGATSGAASAANVLLGFPHQGPTQ